MIAGKMRGAPMNKAFVYLSLFSVILLGCAVDPLRDFDNTYSIVGDDKVIAFVGRKIAVTQIMEEPVATSSDEITIKLDLGFLVRYEILELVHGNYPKKAIDFEAYDHYGFPRFAVSDVAMIYVVEHEGRLFHRKYQWDAVSKTKDGRYAACGDPYADLDEEELADVERRALDRIDFVPAVSFHVSDELKRKTDPERYSPEEIAANCKAVEAYFAPPVFDRRGDVAICKMGVFPDELYRIRYEADFRPAALRDVCKSETGFTDDDWMDVQKKAAVEACVNEKRAKGLPQ